MEQKNHINKKSSVICLAALSIALYFPLLVLISALWMLLGNSINAALVYVTAILDLAILYFFLPEKRIQKILLVIVFDILIVWLSGTIAGKIYDSSFDGQWYHQEGLIQIKNGWNPYEKQYSLPIKDATFFVLHYPHADPISLYAIWRLFPGNIEAAKGLNFILSIIAFILLRQALLLLMSSDKKKKKYVNAIVLLTVLNPVCIYQAFTFYVDGRLYDSLLICMALLIIYHIKQTRQYLFLLALNIIYLINEKFTGLLYAGLMGAGYSAYLLITNQGMRIIRLFPYALVTIATSIMLVGYSSYLKNYIYAHNLLYPIKGGGNISADMIFTLQPANFQGQNTLFKCIYSYTALPGHFRYPDSSVQRNLFDFKAINHYNAYYIADPDTSGFGVYCAELFLLLLPAFFLLLINNGSRLLILIIYSAMFISIVMNSLSFIARYAPHLWLLVVIPLGGLVPFGKILLRAYAWVLLVLCFLNCIGIICAQTGMRNQHERIVSQMTELKKEQPIILYSKWSSIPERLKEKDVQFTLVDRKDSLQKWNEIAFSYGAAFWRK